MDYTLWLLVAYACGTITGIVLFAGFTHRTIVQHTIEALIARDVIRTRVTGNDVEILTWQGQGVDQDS